MMHLPKHLWILFRTRAIVVALGRHRLSRRIAVCTLTLLVCTYALDAVFPFRPQIPYSQIILASDGTVVHAFLSTDDKWRMKIELDEISPLLRSTVVTKEDSWFYWHCGINPVSVLRAAINNVFHWRTTSGASTITMQVARLLEPKERTFINKIREAFRATQLELHYSKDEILQMYVNLIPYGGNIEGVKAASLLYFDRLPQNLSVAQVVTLAVIPNRPTSLRLGEQNPEIKVQRDAWLRRFARSGVLPQELVNDALQEPNVIHRVDVPHAAPHYANKMRRRFPSDPILRTTLDARAQFQCSALCFNYIQRTKMLGIYNCAALVINNQTRCVEAYIGSPNFNDNDHGGQCDGVQAVRSPGSALKPLLYGVALDAGYITPKTILYDVPTDFNGYAPENYDQTFHGPVSVEEALAQSLNIPAVKMLDRIGVQPFAQKLSTIGFKGVKRDAANVGLSLALGGCGVRLEEMAQLYSAFACEGVVRPLHWVPADADTTAQRVLSAASSFMITDILTTLTRPDLPVNYLSATHLPRVAWKTGTSYGRRDAWSVGYNKRYTIAVWVGNFSGEGIADLTGSTSATPLLFELFNALDNNAETDWYHAPPDLDFRVVCAESGLPPGEHCDKTVIDYFIPTVSSSARCSHVQEVAVSHDSKTSYCTACLPRSGYTKKLFRSIAPELLSYYQSENIKVSIPPAHNSSCERVMRENAPRITSPTAAKEYLVAKSDKDAMMLSCSAADDVHSVYWFINDKLVSQAKPQEHVFFTPHRGRNKISCCDDKGRNRNIFVKVDWQ